MLTIAVKLNSFDTFHRKIMYNICGEEKQVFTADLTYFSDFSSTQGRSLKLLGIAMLTSTYTNLDPFRLCTPSFVGAKFLHPSDAHTIFLHNDLLCNSTCSLIRGSITYWGQERKRSTNFCFYNQQMFNLIMRHILPIIIRHLDSYIFLLALPGEM